MRPTLIVDAGILHPQRMEAYLEVAHQVLDGKLQSMTTEKVLAETIDLPRQATREGLALLAAQHIVEQYPGTGVKASRNAEVRCGMVAVAALCCTVSQGQYTVSFR